MWSVFNFNEAIKNLMDPLWLTIAFGCGYLVRQVGLPPLVGFLVAGFVLNALGVVAGETISTLADLGVTLLLFSIGLKLDIRTLLRAEVWAGATLHLLLTVSLTTLAILGASSLGLGLFDGVEPGHCSFARVRFKFFQYRICR